MNICTILNKRIITEFVSSNKEDVINEMINNLKDSDDISDLEKVREVVLEREKIMSTGIGNGFAIPHGKTNAVKEIVAVFGRLSEPMDFDAIDEKPVNLIFLLVGRENSVGEHIKMLSRISRIMGKVEVHQRLLNAESPEAILQIFEEEESKL